MRVASRGVVLTRTPVVACVQAVQNNGSLFLHAYLVKRSHSPNLLDDNYRSDAVIEAHVQLTKFWPPRKEKKLRNLLGGPAPDSADVAAPLPSDVGPVTSALDVPPAAYVSYLHPNITLAVVTDQMVIPHNKYPDPVVMRKAPRVHGTPGGPTRADTAGAGAANARPAEITLDERTGSYKPLFYRNEFWLMREDYMLINSTVKCVSRRHGAASAAECTQPRGLGWAWTRGTGRSTSIWSLRQSR